MRLRSFLLTATTLALPLAAALPTVAQAQPITGLYIGGAGGFNDLEKTNFRSSPGLGITRSLSGQYAPGVVGVGSIGYGLGNGLRFEIEGDYRNNHVSEISGTAGPTHAGGYDQSYGAMFNALYDLDVGLPFVYPYVGAGAGYMWDRLHNIGFTSVNTPIHTLSANDETGNFAFQGILGLAYPIAYVPGLSATLEYRYMGLLGPRGYSGISTGYGPGGARLVGNYDARGTNSNNSALIGLRYAFNAAPPPPPAAPASIVAPAPAPSRTYLVFFDWDRSDLTARAKSIISEAAQNSTHVAYTKIQVNGYTDLSGTAEYNQRLSVRRAQAVAAELVRDGVPRGSINIQGFGESNPLVPTAKGVREPQNRRVEIIIQ